MNHRMKQVFYAQYAAHGSSNRRKGHAGGSVGAMHGKQDAIMPTPCAWRNGVVVGRLLLFLVLRGSWRCWLFDWYRVRGGVYRLRGVLCLREKIL